MGQALYLKSRSLANSILDRGQEGSTPHACTEPDVHMNVLLQAWRRLACSEQMSRLLCAFVTPGSGNIWDNASDARLRTSRPTENVPRISGFRHRPITQCRVVLYRTLLRLYMSSPRSAVYVSQH